MRPVRLVLAVLVLSAGVPVGVFAQQASYLKGVSEDEQAQPGLSGLWTMQGHIGSTAPPRDRLFKTEDGKLPPLLPKAQAVLDQRLKAAEEGHPYSNMGAHCMPEGVPLMLFAAVEGPIEILETPGRVTILSQEWDEEWLIYLDQPHQRDPDPTWHGDSVAHWEGDTLVIDSIGLTDKTTIDYIGIPHSEDLHVVTRLRRLDKDTMEVRATMDDPQTFAAPWTMRVLYKRTPPGLRVEEEVCDNQRNGVDAAGQATFLTYEDTAAGKSPPPTK